MSIQELFIMSNQALLKSVSQIANDQWDLMLPEGSSSKPTNLKDAVRYHTYDDAWVPDVLAGKTKEAVGDTHESLLTSEAVAQNYAHFNQHANDAVRDFTDLDRVTHLSYGDFSANDYLHHIITFRAFRSYDIAKLIGVDATIDPIFAQAMFDEFSPLIESYRQAGIFPPAITVAEDTDIQTKLLALVGRTYSPNK